MSRGSKDQGVFLRVPNEDCFYLEGQGDRISRLQNGDNEGHYTGYRDG